MTDKTEVIETLKAAQSYLNSLQNLNSKIQTAVEQISESSKDTEKSIEAIFSTLINKINDALLLRKEQLIQRVQKTQCQSLVPLEQCKIDILNRIETTNKLIREGNLLLQQENNNVSDFTQKSSTLGSLPEIPELKEVPCQTFQYEQRMKLDLLELCSKFGSVCKIAPVQISQVSEKPGAILIEWNVVDNDDQFYDVQEFKLQRAFGETFYFYDCYVGVENQFLVKDLQPNQLYSFRVCCKFEGANEWSPWSLPQTASTTIKPYSWKTNQDFVLSDENKIATLVKNEPSLIISDGAQFAVGYSIQFTYLELGTTCTSVGIIAAETDDEISSLKLLDLSNFVVDSNGEIFVNGVKKSTILPPATKGSKILFICESIQNHKVRMNVETCDKQVTYDWLIPQTQKLFFAAFLQTPQNKIMVE